MHGFSPASLLFGFEPRGPLHLTLPAPQGDASDAADWLRRRRQVQEQAFDRALDAQVQMLRYANARRAAPQDFKVGDMVFVLAERLPDPNEVHLPAKLRSPYSGPFEVLEVMEHNVKIAVLPPFTRETRLVNKEDCFVFTGELPSEEGAPEEDGTYEVEGVLRWKYAPGRLPVGASRRSVLYEVKWVGAQTPTWVHEEDMVNAGEALEEFWLSQRRAKKKLPPQAYRFMGSPEDGGSN